MAKKPTTPIKMFQLMPPRGGNPSVLPIFAQLLEFQLMPPRGGNQGGNI